MNYRMLLPLVVGAVCGLAVSISTCAPPRRSCQPNISACVAFCAERGGLDSIQHAHATACPVSARRVLCECLQP